MCTLSSIINGSHSRDYRLANKIDAMGGINTMIITHKDDLADHAKWKKRFPDMQRVIHM